MAPLTGWLNALWSCDGAEGTSQPSGASESMELDGGHPAKSIGVQGHFGSAKKSFPRRASLPIVQMETNALSCSGFFTPPKPLRISLVGAYPRRTVLSGCALCLFHVRPRSGERLDQAAVAISRI